MNSIPPGQSPIPALDFDAYRLMRAAVIAAAPTLSKKQRATIERAGALFRQAVTLTDWYRADREAADNRDERNMVWRTYTLALMAELRRRGSPSLPMAMTPKRYKIDAKLPVITREGWQGTLWMHRSDDELLDLYRVLESARYNLKDDQALGSNDNTRSVKSRT